MSFTLLHAWPSMIHIISRSEAETQSIECCIAAMSADDSQGGAWYTGTAIIFRRCLSPQFLCICKLQLLPVYVFCTYALLCSLYAECIGEDGILEYDVQNDRFIALHSNISGTVTISPADDRIFVVESGSSIVNILIPAGAVQLAASVLYELYYDSIWSFAIQTPSLVCSNTICIQALSALPLIPLFIGRSLLPYRCAPLPSMPKRCHHISLALLSPWLGTPGPSRFAD